MDTLLDKMYNCEHGLAIDLNICHTKVPGYDNQQIVSYLRSFSAESDQYMVVSRGPSHTRIRSYYDFMNSCAGGEDCKMNPQKLGLFQRKLNGFGLRGKEMYQVKIQEVKDDNLAVLDWFAEICKPTPGVTVGRSIATITSEEMDYLKAREVKKVQTQPAKVMKKNMTKDEKIFNHCQAAFQGLSPSDEELFCAICEHLVSINTIKINPEEICDYVCGVKLKLGLMDSKELFRKSRMWGNE